MVLMEEVEYEGDVVRIICNEARSHVEDFPKCQYIEECIVGQII
jgi:hypothetical protein